MKKYIQFIAIVFIASSTHLFASPVRLPKGSKQKVIKFETHEGILSGRIYLPKPSTHVRKSPAIFLVRDYALDLFVKGFSEPFFEDLLIAKLVERGFVVFTYALRNSGYAPLQTHVRDAKAALEALATHPDIDASSMGIISRGMGSSVAAKICRDTDAFSYAVALAAPATRGQNLIIEQIITSLKSKGAKQKRIDLQTRNVCSLAESLLQNDTKGANKLLNSLLTPGLAKKARKVIHLPWMKEFINHDPCQDWKHISLPVYAVYCEKDSHVPLATHMPKLEAALENGNTPAYEIKTVPLATHKFCKNNAKPRFEPEFLDSLINWIQKQN